MGIREIPLSRGLVAIVDDADYPLVSQYTWHARKSHNFYYATTWVGPRASRVPVPMHRMIMGAQPGQIVDHIDRDTLNNSRTNLRFVDHLGNLINTAMWASNSSGYRGVSWNARRNKWRACIGIDGKNKDIGHYCSAEEAARAYDRVARDRWGEEAFLNFPDEVAA